MQGRLLPKYKGRYQAHPLGNWQKEFEVASLIGLDCIEFILDYNESHKNPLLKKEGIKEIHSLIRKTRITVKTICADYFMQNSLLDMNIAHKSISTLKMLIKNGKKYNGTSCIHGIIQKQTWCLREEHVC